MSNFSLPTELKLLVSVKDNGRYVIHLHRVLCSVAASLDLDVFRQAATHAFATFTGHHVSPTQEFGLLVKCTSAETMSFVVVRTMPYDSNHAFFSTFKSVHTLSFPAVVRKK
jgi:hypothetical protein